jgi:hypothetical protein
MALELDPKDAMAYINRAAANSKEKKSWNPASAALIRPISDLRVTIQAIVTHMTMTP